MKRWIAIWALTWCGAVMGQTHDTAEDRWVVTPRQRLIARVVFAEGCDEPIEGKIAIAAVILNRLMHPAYPHELEDVIYQPMAFSSYWDDSRLWQLGGRHFQMNDRQRRAWDESMEAAQRAMLGEGDARIIAFRHVRLTGGEGYFGRLMEVATIGHHRFYGDAATATTAQ